MGSKSQAAKGGLAAGLVFGLMIGLLHLGTLAGCSSAQLGYINHQLLVTGQNATANAIYSFDLVYYPMVNGLFAFVLAVILAVGYGALYLRIPGKDSKRKGEVWALPVFVVALVAGPAYIPYECDPSFIPYIATFAAIPATVIFGYLLGVFYDAFGRLAIEQREELEAAKKKELDERKARQGESSERHIFTSRTIASLELKVIMPGEAWNNLESTKITSNSSSMFDEPCIKRLPATIDYDNNLFSSS
jgi:hypothetical protein